MWIIPKNLPTDTPEGSEGSQQSLLHTSSYVLDTEASEEGLKQLSEMSEQSLMWRSKPSQQQTWLRRWKKALEGKTKGITWLRLLSGRILKPSLSKRFEEKWISYLEDSHANRSVLQGKEEETKTQDTCSLTSLMESSHVDLISLFWKTSKGSSQLNSRQTNGETQLELPFCFMSLESWSEWVTTQRQSRLARQKSERLTRGTDGLSTESWPTSSTRDWKDTSGMKSEGVNPDGSKRKRLDQLPRAVYAEEAGQQDQDNNNTAGSHLELSEEGSSVLNRATPNTMDSMAQRSEEALRRQASGDRKGRSRPANLREQVDPDACRIYKECSDVSSKIDWPTSRTSDAEGGRIETEITENGFRSKRKQSDQWFGAKLRDAVETFEEQKNWGTPRVTTNGGCPSPQATGKGSRLEDQVAVEASGSYPTPTTNCYTGTGQPDNKQGSPNLQTACAGKLNPRWVETLMGLPIGWCTPNPGGSLVNRTDELRLLGNGVVWQSCEAATYLALDYFKEKLSSRHLTHLGKEAIMNDINSTPEEVRPSKVVWVFLPMSEYKKLEESNVAGMEGLSCTFAAGEDPSDVYLVDAYFEDTEELFSERLGSMQDIAEMISGCLPAAIKVPKSEVVDSLERHIELVEEWGDSLITYTDRKRIWNKDTYKEKRGN